MDYFIKKFNLFNLLEIAKLYGSVSFLRLNNYLNYKLRANMYDMWALCGCSSYSDIYKRTVNGKVYTAENGH